MKKLLTVSYVTIRPCPKKGISFRARGHLGNSLSLSTGWQYAPCLSLADGARLAKSLWGKRILLITQVE